MNSDELLALLNQGKVIENLHAPSMDLSGMDRTADNNGGKG